MGRSESVLVIGSLFVLDSSSRLSVYELFSRDGSGVHSKRDACLSSLVLEARVVDRSPDFAIQTSPSRAQDTDLSTPPGPIL